jgi:hypothetical protein
MISMSNPAPMDVVIDGFPEYDDNGILYQPKWGWQVTHRGEFPSVGNLCHGKPFEPFANFQQTCTTNAIYTDSGFFCGVGHINWCPATYEGRIFWDGHAGSDDDYNVCLIPSLEGAGFTAANLHFHGHEPGAFECEFDSDETIDHFNTAWWNEFHNAVDNDNNKAHRMIDNRRAIITGLLGIDSEHNSYAELHPVWALALEVQPPHQGGGTYGSSRWAMFIRNWGNEGFCADLDHQVRFYKNRYTFLLPYPYEVPSDLLTFAGFRSNNFLTNYPSQVTGPWVTTVNWLGSPRIRVTFTGIPDPNQHPFIEGDISLDFNQKSAAAPVPKAGKIIRSAYEAMTIKIAYKRLKYKKKKDQGEQYFERLEKRLSPKKMKVFRQMLEEGNVIKDRNLDRKVAEPKPAINERLRTFTRLSFGRPTMAAQRSNIREQKNKNLYNALHKAFDGKIPKELWLR